MNRKMGIKINRSFWIYEQCFLHLKFLDIKINRKLTACHFQTQAPPGRAIDAASAWRIRAAKRPPGEFWGFVRMVSVP
jgi:hypothetical protein